MSIQVKIKGNKIKVQAGEGYSFGVKVIRFTTEDGIMQYEN